MHRNTYVEINLKNIEYNVKKLIETYNDYKYYFGVVKADAYSHHGIKTIKAIIKSGVNYLAVATLDEALEIRKYIKDIPILCLGIIPIEYISICKEKNITITISNLEYLNELLKLNIDHLKIHIKINTGMNRLGFKNKEELNIAYNKIINSKLILEGIYTHIYNVNNKNDTLKQYDNFTNIVSDIDINNIPIIHVSASESTMNYKKYKFANGCRFGIAMYGLVDNSLDLKSTFSLYSEVIQINNIDNESVGYNGAYKTNKKEKIAVIPIGYADGFIRKNSGNFVYINDKKYKIIGNICMDMMFILIDDNVHVHDKVTIIKDNEHIKEIASHLDTITYEVICSIGKRVPRIYIK